MFSHSIYIYLHVFFLSFYFSFLFLSFVLFFFFLSSFFFHSAVSYCFLYFCFFSVFLSFSYLFRLDSLGHYVLCFSIVISFFSFLFYLFTSLSVFPYPPFYLPPTFFGFFFFRPTRFLQNSSILSSFFLTSPFFHSFFSPSLPPFLALYHPAPFLLQTPTSAPSILLFFASCRLNLPPLVKHCILTSNSIFYFHFHFPHILTFPLSFSKNANGISSCTFFLICLFHCLNFSRDLPFPHISCLPFSVLSHPLFPMIYLFIFLFLTLPLFFAIPLTDI